MSTEIGNAVARLMQAMQTDFEICLQRACDKLAQYCDSPIELMIGVNLAVGLNLGRPGSIALVPPGSERPPEPGATIQLHPQFQWGGYRFDFALVTKWTTLLVECDGHDFHERTKEQAARDRQKDRAAQEAGFTILRFTGSEIYRDPTACCIQIINCLKGNYDRAEAQK